jgi:LEA14-like dessication related protein
MRKEAEEMRRNIVSAWVVILVVLVSGCASLFWMGEKPHVDIVNVTPKEMRLLEQTFLLELRIQNPTETDLDINGMSFELEINGQPFARGVSNQSLKVERLSTKVVQVEAYTGLTSILRQLSEARKGSYASGFKYRLKGSIHTGAPSFRIPFDETGEFK